jgi:hypothetical protein
MAIKERNIGKHPVINKGCCVSSKCGEALNRLDIRAADQ